MTLDSREATPEPDMPWVQDTFDAYRLEQAKLDAYLKKKFGNWKFSVTMKNDKYLFQVPRLLTEDEKEDLMDLRW
ncbi:hypothetical protein SLS56_001843 [Neofusicoccum ribis]|uniref:Uncharacterized protein n=1 Tax=Neofusicoccum ribis TaxID=45134 RepID=A0ABR3T6B3_9PEZI